LREKPDPVNVKNQTIVRPDSSKVVNREIAEETKFSNKFEYEPWIEFKNIDYKGKHVNVKNSVRRSDPEIILNPSFKDTTDIYFFGGSTMFGFNVADNETIPSTFARLYRQRVSSGKTIMVHNFAAPTYYSYHELVQFSNLIFKGHRPDIVIFLDGINDFWFAKTSYYDQTYFSYILRQVFNKNLLVMGKFKLKDTSERLFMDPTNMPLDQFNNTLIDHYFNNISNEKMMADLINCKSYFFCQPVPFYKYPNQQKDPICFKDTNTRFNYIYPIVEKRSSLIQNFTFLGNMLQNEHGNPFVDGLHYSPEFIKKVAEKILNAVEKDIR
jgi:hypothetical protein